MKDLHEGIVLTVLCGGSEEEPVALINWSHLMTDERVKEQVSR